MLLARKIDAADALLKVFNESRTLLGTRSVHYKPTTEENINLTISDDIWKSEASAINQQSPKRHSRTFLLSERTESCSTAQEPS